MKVQATKALTSLLKKEVLKDDNFKGYKITFEKVSQEYYQYYVDYDIFNNDIDLDLETGKMKAIKIEYPTNYYACNKYLTTKILNDLFNHCDKTLSGFIQKVKEEIEI